MSNLSKRLVVRISEELEQWIGAQAELEGLDSATWVRSILTRMRNGRLPMAGKPVPISGIVDFSMDIPSASMTESGPSTAPLSPDPIPVEVDTDAMVAAALGKAESEGLTEPSNGAFPDPPAGGVRALHRPQVPFSPNAQPDWIQDH